MKKIDAHLHVAKILAGYCRRGELRGIGDGLAQWGNGEIFQLIPRQYGDKEFLIETALEIMATHEVERAVLMQGSMYGFQNNYHLDILRKYPDQFCPSCTIDPYMTNYLDTMKKFLFEDGFKLAKFEVSSGGGLMGCHHPFALNSPEMLAIYSLLEERDGILALDVGDLTMASHQPENLYAISRQFPKLKLVVCHMLAPTSDTFPEILESLALLNRDNIWFDIAALPKIVDGSPYPYPETLDILEQALALLGSQKLMWGTDAPYATTRDSYTDLANYLPTSGRFSTEELENIYYQNAYTVYFK